MKIIPKIVISCTISLLINRSSSVWALDYANRIALDDFEGAYRPGPSSSMPSDLPSNLPSDYIMPSDYPSNMPSDYPSVVPSDFPSVIPSSIPSSFPVVTTSIPQAAPPVLPPSVPPTAIPTSSPTLECHDMSDYVSPINEFSCKDHRGTDCTQWRFLGLSVDEVQSLITSCPISCSVDCGAYRKFDIDLKYRIQNVNTYLDPLAVTRMQDSTLEFVTKEVQSVHFSSRFFLYEVELLSQQILVREEDPQERVLEENLVDLLVTTAFRGFAIDLDDNSLALNMREAVASKLYALSLQKSGDEDFREVTVSFDLQEVPQAAVDEIEQVQRSGVSTGVKLISGFLIAVSIVVAVCFFGYCRMRRSESLEKRGISSEIVSPANSFMSPLDPARSFESIGRMISGMSNTSRASRDSPKTEGESSHSSSVGKRWHSSSRIINENDVHPLTGIIPPMIVYDNIDEDGIEDYSTPMKEENGHRRNIVPTRRVVASPDMVAAISTGSAADHNIRKPVPGLIISPIDLERGVVSSEESEHLIDSSIHVYTGSKMRKVNTEDDNHYHESATSRPTLSGTIGSTHKSEMDGSQVVLEDGASSPFVAYKSDSPLGRRSSIDRVRTFSEATTIKTGLVVDGNEKELPVGQDIDRIPNLLQGFWKRTQSRVLRRSASTSTDGSGAPERIVLRNKRRRRPQSLDSNTSCELVPAGVEHVFKASRKGRLGLAIEIDEATRVMVTKVKDYSPLLGQILPGDQIVGIDGMETSLLTPVRIQALLGGVSAGSQSATIRIMVWRLEKETLGASETELRWLGYSMDSGETSEILPHRAGEDKEWTDLDNLSSDPEGSERNFLDKFRDGYPLS